MHGRRISIRRCKLIKFYLQHISLIALCVFSHQSGATDDLITVYQQALKSDPQLLAEAASRQAVGELATQADARFRPEIGLTANTGHIWQDQSASLFGGKRDYNAHGYTLNITQPLYRRQNIVQRQQANIEIAHADIQYQQAEQDLIVRTATRYFDVLARQADVRFSEAEKDAIALQYEQATMRLEVGVATITDVHEAQAAEDLATATIIAAQNALENSQIRLTETTGEQHTDLANLKAELSLVRPAPEDSNQWQQKALTHNPSLQAAQLAVEQAKKQISLQRSGYYPSVDLVGQHAYSSTSDGGFGASKTKQSSLSVQLNIPLYAGGAVRSRTQEAKFRLDQTMHQQEQKRREIIRQSRESYNSVISGLSRIKALAQAVKSSESALETTEAGYDVGTRTTVDVLNVRRDLFRARRDYVQARYNYIVDTLKLKQAVGLIAEQDLIDINQWLETKQ